MASQQELQRAAEYLKKNVSTRTGGFNVAPKAPLQPVPEPERNFFDAAIGSVIDATEFVVKAPFRVSKAIWDDTYRIFDSVSDSIVEVVTGNRQMQLQRNRESSDALNNIQRANMENYKAGRITLREYEENNSDLASQYKEIGDSNKLIEYESDTTARIADVVQLGLMPLAGGRLTNLPNMTGKLMRTKAISSVTASLNKVPSVRAILAERNANLLLLSGREMLNPKLVWQAAKELGWKGFGRELGMTSLIRFPLVVGQTTGDVYEIIKSLQGEGGRGMDTAVGRGLFLGLAAFEGGPLGFAFKAARKVGAGGKSLLFGTGSWADELGKQLKLKGNVVSALEKVKKLEAKGELASGTHKRLSEGMRGMQNITLQMANDSPELGARMVVDFYTEARGFGKIDFPIKSWDDLFEDMARYYDNFERLEDAIKKGLIKVNGEKLGGADVRKYALATFDGGAKSSLIRGLKEAQKAGGREAMVDFLKIVEAKGAYYTQHDTLWPFIKEVIKEDDWEKQIKNLTTTRFMKEMKLPKELREQFSKDGYIVVRMQKRARQTFIERGTGREIVSKFAGDIDGYEKVIEPTGLARTLGSAIRKAGLSPEDTSKVTYDALKRNVADALDDVAKSNDLVKLALNSSPTGKIDDAAVIVHKLQKFASNPDNLESGGAIARGLRSAANRSEVQDIRMLNDREIAKAVFGTIEGVPTSEAIAAAKQIRRAIYQAHINIPLQVRGLGDWILDRNFMYNPLARPYARAQSALRYAWNPFFRTQEIVETEVLGQVVTGGKKVQFPGVNAVRHIFRRTNDEMDGFIRVLRDSEVLSGQFFGEAADDAVLGRITAVISRSQEESLAGIAVDMAKRRFPGVAEDKALEQMLLNHYDEVIDALRVVVQYPNKSALNSSLARTLNLAFFPMRYNLKVTGIAAKALSQQPISVQLATIKGIYDMRDWLNSDEGRAWYADHYEAIGVMQWITPIGSLTQVLDLIDGGVPDSIGELGQLGGLPFGVFTQMLDSQIEGFNLNTPYVSPKDGSVLPEWIPQSASARVRTAMNDLLMSVFTYPGRIVGLTGKGAIVRDATGRIIPYEPEAYKKVYRGAEGTAFINPGLTEEQQEFQRVVRENYGTMPTYEGSYQGPVLPPGPLPPKLTFNSKPVPPEMQKKAKGSGGRKEYYARPVQKR